MFSLRLDGMGHGAVSDAMGIAPQESGFRGGRARWGNKTPAQRFAEKWVADDASGCWLWVAHRLPSGYGQFYFNGGRELAHRASYAIHRGPIPAGMCVCHSCDRGDAGCVNPEHLFLGTKADNHADMVAKGRHFVPTARHDAAWRASMPRGVSHHKSKLNDRLVREIREAVAAGVDQWSIARRVGVHQSTVWKIASGKTWKHVA